jgi:hypothetical protein
LATKKKTDACLFYFVSLTFFSIRLDYKHQNLTNTHKQSKLLFKYNSCSIRGLEVIGRFFMKHILSSIINAITWQTKQFADP